MTTGIDMSNQTLEVGDYLLNGAIVLDCTMNALKGNGLYASWVAVCLWQQQVGNHVRNEYVVWNVIARPEGFVAERGDYYSSIIPAVDCYAGRGGK